MATRSPDSIVLITSCVFTIKSCRIRSNAATGKNRQSHSIISTASEAHLFANSCRPFPNSWYRQGVRGISSLFCASGNRLRFLAWCAECGSGNNSTTWWLYVLETRNWNHQMNIVITKSLFIRTNTQHTAEAEENQMPNPEAPEIRLLFQPFRFADCSVDNWLHFYCWSRIVVWLNGVWWLCDHRNRVTFSSVRNKKNAPQ